MKSIIFILLLTSCTRPMGYTHENMKAWDKDTEYEVTERPNGFTLTINYERYQFIPEGDALTQACKSALTSIAYDYAEKQGRKIDPVNEQRIKLSLGRNGLTGFSSCSAQAPVDYKKN
ncbi:MAG: hypothetical protein K2Q12_08175 [Rickettsiales bacterium]|nr:hypothetical protein [Rickettsiales bacterium]